MMICKHVFQKKNKIGLVMTPNIKRDLILIFVKKTLGHVTWPSGMSVGPRLW